MAQDGASDRDMWVNLFVKSRAQFQVGATPVKLAVDTHYPWAGQVKITVDPGRRFRGALRVRIPGWAREVVVPGGLYTYVKASGGSRAGVGDVRLNGMSAHAKESKDYLVIDREWRSGDVIELNLPMPIRQVVARAEVEADRSRVALQRGPLVYCIEGADNPGLVWNSLVPADVSLREKPYQVLQEAVIAIEADANALLPTPDGQGTRVESRILTAIPFYAWANRNNYEMQVWMPTQIGNARIEA